MSDTLDRLQAVIEQRLAEADPEGSYVASLHARGLNKILEKLGEECVETIIAAKDANGAGGRDAVVYETADLWFHSMVMLAELNISSADVLEELARRFDLSGIEEKRARQQK